jgi:hypothetical protein
MRAGAGETVKRGEVRIAKIRRIAGDVLLKRSALRFSIDDFSLQKRCFQHPPFGEAAASR